MENSKVNIHFPNYYFRRFLWRWITHHENDYNKDLFFMEILNLYEQEKNVYISFGFSEINSTTKKANIVINDKTFNVEILNSNFGRYLTILLCAIDYDIYNIKDLNSCYNG